MLRFEIRTIKRRSEMKKYLYSLTMVLYIAAFAGCNPYNNEGEGAAAGGALGMLAGGVIGHQSHDTGAGMLIGGAVGAVTGAAIGSTVQKPVYEQPAPVVVTQAAPVVSPGPDGNLFRRYGHRQCP